MERVWTQAVLDWLRQTGVLNDVDFLRASARLEAFHYSGTWVNPGVLVEAGRLANWQANSFVLQRNLRALGDRTAVPANRLQMALDFILAVVNEVSLEPSRDALIITTLERLRDRPVGMRIVQELARRLQIAMRLNPIRAHQVLPGRSGRGCSRSGIALLPRLNRRCKQLQRSVVEPQSEATPLPRHNAVRRIWARSTPENGPKLENHSKAG